MCILIELFKLLKEPNIVHILYIQYIQIVNVLQAQLLLKLKFAASFLQIQVTADTLALG